MGYQALLFCPDEKLARVVSQVFGDLDFSVDAVSEPFGAVKKLMAQRYDAVVVDSSEEQNTSLLFKSARNSSFNQTALAIALVEGQAGVAKAYRTGANLVLTKPINVEQVKGTLRVARGLLRKSSEGPAATAPAKPVAAAAPPVRPAPPVQRTVEPVPAPPVAPPPLVEEHALPAMAASAKSGEKPDAVPTPIAQSAAPAAAAAESAPSMPATLFAAEAARSEAPKPAPPVAASNTSSHSQGAATAAAPAKEIAVPAAKPVEKETRSVSTKPSDKAAARDLFDEPQIESPAAVSRTADAPSFAALGEEDHGGSGGSKKILVAAVVVLALAAAGYFGWTKLGSSHPSTTPHPAAPVQQPPAKSGPPPEAVPMSAPVTAPSPAVTNKASAAVPVAPPKTTAQATQILADAGAASQVSVAPAPDARKPAAPIVVKGPGAKTHKESEDAAVQLPSPLGVSPQGDSSLNGVLSSASASRPSLARINVSQGVSQGLLIKRVQPRYPSAALASHIQGTVEIEATISKDGVVLNPKAVRGDKILAGAALDAVRQWRYKPYYLDGEPVEIQTLITINFKAN